MKCAGHLMVVTLLSLGFASAAPAQLAKPQEQPVGAQQMTQFIDVMEKYLYVVDHLTRMSENPTAAGVAAVLQANEILKSHPREAIDYFNKVLPDVKNEAIKRAIRLQLADLYKSSNENDKALDQLRELMAGAPVGPSRPRPAPDVPPAQR